MTPTSRLGRNRLPPWTTLAVVVWAAAWALLAIVWRGKDTDLRRIFALGLVLGILGAIGTFPPVFEAFAAE